MNENKPDNASLRQARYSQAAMAILNTRNLEDAAFLCNISTRTLTRYLADPEFQAMLADLQQQTIEASAMSLAGASGKAVAALVDILADKDTPFGIRARVSEIILNQSLRWAEQVSLANRVKQLELTKAARGNQNV